MQVVVPELLQTALFSADTLAKVAAVASASTPSSTGGWPEYTDSSNGSWVYFPATEWTSGFFPSTLYALNYRETSLCQSSNGTKSTTQWLDLARDWHTSDYDDAVSALTDTHDVGFLSYPAQWELSINPVNRNARGVIATAAEHLAARYSPITGTIRSWDQGGPDDFEVIIDNMMNLQILAVAAGMNYNATYRDIATSHANKTAQNHIRPDGSTYQIVDYSASTGEVLWRGTAQGLNNQSTWSRGQSWAMYGFTQLYGLFDDVAYLDVARQAAGYYLSHLPSGSGVPYWDFDAPTASPIDTSSATIAASALLNMSSIEASMGNVAQAANYSSAAIQLLSAAVQQGAAGWTGRSILGNGTVNYRADPPIANVGTVYGDYYFIEAGNRLLEMGLVNCTNGQPARSSSSSGSPNGANGANGANSVTLSAAPSGSAGASSGGVHTYTYRASCSLITLVIAVMTWLLA